MEFSDEEASSDMETFLAEEPAEEMEFDGGDWDDYLAEEPAEEMVFSDDEAGLGGGSAEDVRAAMGHWGDAADNISDSLLSTIPSADYVSDSLLATNPSNPVATAIGTGATGISALTVMPDVIDSGNHALRLGRDAARLSGPRSVSMASKMPSSGLGAAARGAGGAASVLSMGVAGADMVENGLNLQNSSDMTVGGIGLAGAIAGGPVGMVAGAFSAGYGVGQFADQQLGISDAIVDGITEDRYTGPRDRVSLEYINEKRLGAKYRGMWATTDEERAEAEREEELFENMREERESFRNPFQ